MELLYRYQAYTLIDITRTNVINQDGSQQKFRNQQRNWETVVQLLSLRAQLLEAEYIGVKEDDVSGYSFGVNYHGIHKIWQFTFAVEHDGIFTVNNDRYSIIKDDFTIAPIILGLDETAEPALPLFFTSGPDKNTYFNTSHSTVNNNK